jgi:hypothetical protein
MPAFAARGYLGGAAKKKKRLIFGETPGRQT